MPLNSPATILTNSSIDVLLRYKAVICDVWGVLHNGVNAFAPAVSVLEEYRTRGGKVILVSNAPRPSPIITQQLLSLNVTEKAYDTLLTSGDITREQMLAHGANKIYHLGPERDKTLFSNMAITLVDLDEAELIVCTGLFDDETETPDDYREILEKALSLNLRMICANPDLVVERGEKLIWCAGGIADLFLKMNGTVFFAGKPHAPIYVKAKTALEERLNHTLLKSDILAVGDALRTDIKGAINFQIDCLMIAGGIHASELCKNGSINIEQLNSRLHEEGISKIYAMSHLY